MGAAKKDGLSRIQRAAKAQALRERGFNNKQISVLLGISYGYTRSLLTDPDGSGDRARKERYRGTCMDCGGKTTYGTKTKRCKACSRKYENVLRTKWTRERIIADIQRWNEIYGEPPKAQQWLTEVRGDGTRDSRPWPHVACVQKEFGSWSNGLEAAGFDRRINYERTDEWKAKVTKWSKERIIEKMQEWADEYGQAPTNRDWRDAPRDRWPNPNVVYARFRTWTAAVEAAGLRPRLVSGRRTRYELMELEPALLYPSNGSKGKVKVPTFSERGEGRSLLDVVNDLKRGR